MKFLISRTELYLQDLPINLDDVTELQDSSVFRINRDIAIIDKFQTDLVVGIAL